MRSSWAFGISFNQKPSYINMKIRYFAVLRNITGLSEETWNTPAETLQDLISALAVRYGSEFRRWVCSDEGCYGNLAILLVNGVDARSLQGMSTVLQPDDTVYIFPPMAGG